MKTKNTLQSILVGLAVIFNFNLARAEITRPYLYAITKDGKTSYILGTFHMGISLNEFPPAVLNLISAMPQFAGERAWTLEQAKLQLDAKTDYLNLIDKLKGRALTEKQLLTSSQKKKLLGFGLPAEFINVISPVDPLCGVISNFHHLFDPEKRSMDFQLVVEARTKGRPIYELETQELRDEAMKQVSENTCTVRDLISGEAKPAEVQLQNVEEYYQKYREGRLEVREQETKSVTLRNQMWVPRIESLHSQAPTLFFVGADHLTQRGNVLEMLKQKGFEVKGPLSEF